MLLMTMKMLMVMVTASSLHVAVYRSLWVQAQRCRVPPNRLCATMIVMGWQAEVSAVDSGGVIAADLLEHCTLRDIEELSLASRGFMIAIGAGFRGDRTFNVVDFLTVRATGLSSPPRSGTMVAAAHRADGSVTAMDAPRPLAGQES